MRPDRSDWSPTPPRSPPPWTNTSTTSHTTCKAKKSDSISLASTAHCGSNVPLTTPLSSACNTPPPTGLIPKSESAFAFARSTQNSDGLMVFADRFDLTDALASVSTAKKRPSNIQTDRLPDYHSLCFTSDQPGSAKRSLGLQQSACASPSDIWTGGGLGGANKANERLFNTEYAPHCRSYSLNAALAPISHSSNSFMVSSSSSNGASAFLPYSQLSPGVFQPMTTRAVSPLANTSSGRHARTTSNTQPKSLSIMNLDDSLLASTFDSALSVKEQFGNSSETFGGTSNDNTSRTIDRHHHALQSIKSVFEAQSPTTADSFKRSASSPVTPRHQAMKAMDPVGIFIRGFPDYVKIFHIVDAFSHFGDIPNVGIESKMGYAYIDFDNPRSVYEAVEATSTYLFFGMSEPLQVQFRYQRSATPQSATTISTRHYHSDKEDSSVGASVCESNATADWGLKSGESESNKNIDYRSLRLLNCPLHVTRSELDKLVVKIGDIKKFKWLPYFPRTQMKSQQTSASSFEADYNNLQQPTLLIGFRSSAIASRAATLIAAQGHISLRDVKTPIKIEYPAIHSSRYVNNDETYERNTSIPPVYSFQPDNQQLDGIQRQPFLPKQRHTQQHAGYQSTASQVKRAKKQATAENRIVYIRHLDAGITNTQDLRKLFEQDIGRVVSCHIIYKQPGAASKEVEIGDDYSGDGGPVNAAFVVFEYPHQAATAVAYKHGGCALPRHKRVDFPDVPIDLTAEEVLEFLAPAGDIKQIILPKDYIDHDKPTLMVEFVSAMSAAKAIVLSREQQAEFMRRHKGEDGSEFILADYSPSVRKDESTSCSPTHDDEAALNRARTDSAYERRRWSPVGSECVDGVRGLSGGRYDVGAMNDTGYF